MRAEIDRMRERAEIAERDRGILLRHVARLREAAEWRLWHGHTPHCRARLSKFIQECNCGHDHLQRVVRETDPLTTLPTDPAAPGANRLPGAGVPYAPSYDEHDTVRQGETAPESDGGTDS